MTQQTTGQDLSASLADRYGGGRRSGARIAMVVAGAVLVGSLLAWAGWVAFSTARAPVRWADGSFSVVDDGHAKFSFDVTTTPGRSAVCTVRMFNDGMTEVGRMDVPVGPSTHGTFTVTTVVPTFETAVSATVRACAVR